MKVFCFFVSCLSAIIFSGCASTPTPLRVFIKPPEAWSTQVFVYDQKPWAPETRTISVEQWPGGSANPRWYQPPQESSAAASAPTTSKPRRPYAPVGYPVVGEVYYPSYAAYYPSYGVGYAGAAGFGYASGYPGFGYSTWPFSSTGTYTSFGLGYGFGVGINTYPGYYGGYGCRDLNHGIFGNYGPRGRGHGGNGGGHHR